MLHAFFFFYFWVSFVLTPGNIVSPIFVVIPFIIIWCLFYNATVEDVSFFFSMQDH